MSAFSQGVDLMIPTPKIVNVVSTFLLNTTDAYLLQEIASKCGNSEYNPRRFNAAIMRLKNPKGTCMIYRNGKIVMLGLRSETDTMLCSRKIIKKLHKLGMCEITLLRPVEITNVVANVVTKIRVNLESMNIGEDGAQYEPDSFPGLVYRQKSPKSTFLVFSNGNVVINGVRGEHKISEAFNVFYPKLLQYRIYGKIKRKFYDRKQFILI